ncbi:MAG: FCD domain-containing protein, partial [Selenomonadaceae bacterium]|nr:FCD domain-containing protein [Selenomonadaceae bacterium]
RIAIETYSLCRLAESIHTHEGKDALRKMEACLKEKMESLRDVQEHYRFMQVDMEFHGISILFTNNEYFMGMHRMMRAQLERVTISSLVYQGRHAAALQEHEAIFREVSRGNGQEAAAALEKHMWMTEEILTGHLLT